MNIKPIVKKYLNILSPGFVIEIFQNDIIQETIMGKISYDENKLANKETLYDIASLTKTFTAVLVFIAIEEKLLSLDSKISNLDNNFVNLKEVSILDLLTHRKEIWTKGYLGDAKEKEEYYKILYTAFIKNKKRKYVDVHYIILSTVLERIYNKSYDCLVSEKIIKKLHLDSLSFEPKTKNIASTNYERRDSLTVIDDVELGLIHDPKARQAKIHGIYTGHASMFINGSDMAKFLKSFCDCSLLKKETIDLMLKHDDITNENFNFLKSIDKSLDINEIYKTKLENNPNFYLPRTMNYIVLDIAII